MTWTQIWTGWLIGNLTLLAILGACTIVTLVWRDFRGRSDIERRMRERYRTQRSVRP